MWRMKAMCKLRQENRSADGSCVGIMLWKTSYYSNYDTTRRTKSELPPQPPRPNRSFHTLPLIQENAPCNLEVKELAKHRGMFGDYMGGRRQQGALRSQRDPELKVVTTYKGRLVSSPMSSLRLRQEYQRRDAGRDYGHTPCRILPNLTARAHGGAIVAKSMGSILQKLRTEERGTREWSEESLELREGPMKLLQRGFRKFDLKKFMFGAKNHGISLWKSLSFGQPFAGASQGLSDNKGGRGARERSTKRWEMMMLGRFSGVSNLRQKMMPKQPRDHRPNIWCSLIVKDAYLSQLEVEIRVMDPNLSQDIFWGQLMHKGAAYC
ncbi:hypothetical protein B0H11DRAFT_1936415 [Mycena galericulata]|nr:hypothetical protein B0H11DRAFT_1936415 [Mycena galericulata]